MKSMLRLFIVSLVTLAFATAGYAQGTAAPSKKEEKGGMKAEKKAEKKEEKAKTKTSRVTGEVVSVDSMAGTLTVKSKDKEMKFTAETKGAKNALQKVKVGETVRVFYSEKDGKMVASSVSEVKSKAKGEAKKGEEKPKGEAKGKVEKRGKAGGDK